MNEFIFSDVDGEHLVYKLLFFFTSRERWIGIESYLHNFFYRIVTALLIVLLMCKQSILAVERIYQWHRYKKKKIVLTYRKSCKNDVSRFNHCKSSLIFLLALVNCHDPGFTVNGQKRGSRYWTGEFVASICHPGYRLVGLTNIMCLPSGNRIGIPWDHLLV